MEKDFKESILKSLQKFFEKYPELEVRRYVCYFYLGMLKMRGREELMNDAIVMLIEMNRGIEGVAEKISEERRSDFLYEIFSLGQKAFSFFRMSEESVKEIRVYCEEQVTADAESLEAYLGLKLPANNFFINYFKTVPEQLICANAVLTMTRGHYSERFSLISENELTEPEVIEIIKPFYLNKGHKLFETESRYLIFENEEGFLNVVVSVDNRMVEVTVDQTP